MKVVFKHPTTGIQCVGEWDQEGETLMFSVENVEEAERNYSVAKLQRTYDWCMRNNINCDSETHGNNHLLFLGIKERLK